MGGSSGASKVARDISERRRAERERAEFHRRLTTLVEASASLLHSSDASSVVAATMEVAQRLLVADGYALWASDPEQGSWRVLESAGVSATFAGRVVASHRDAPAPGMAPFSEALCVSDVDAHPLLAGQLGGLSRRGHPLDPRLPDAARGGPCGHARLLLSRPPRSSPPSTPRPGRPSPTSPRRRWRRRISTTSCGWSATPPKRPAAGPRSWRTRPRSCPAPSTTRRRSRPSRGWRCPRWRDWCAVDVVGPGGRLQRVAVAHVDPAKVEHARELDRRYPEQPGTPGTIHDVIRTARPAMLASIPPELLAAHARDDEHARMLAALS